MLNEYLNKYAQKLSRGNSNNPYEIKIDQAHYDNILLRIENSTYNPYHHIIDERKMKGSLLFRRKVSKDTQPKYLEHLVNSEEYSDNTKTIAAQL